MMKVNICSTVTGASAYMVFIGKPVNEKNIFRVLAILETSRYFIYFMNEEFMKAFANGKGNFPLCNMLELLFFLVKCSIDHKFLTNRFHTHLTSSYSLKLLFG